MIINYRSKQVESQTQKIDAITFLSKDLDLENLKTVLNDIQSDFSAPQYGLDFLYTKYQAFTKPQMSQADKLAALLKASTELTTVKAPDWEFIAARLLYVQFENQLKTNMAQFGVSTLYEKILFLTQHKLYGTYILENYSKKEIEEAQTFIDTSRNKLFTISGLDLLLKRYVIKTHDYKYIETPQELFLGIALHLAMKEKNNRLSWVKKFYDMLSLQKVSMATPTMANARKPYHQLSSCFIDTVPDSLDGIFRSIDNFAKVSKFGGGMGLYFGKVRAVGSAIRDFKGVAGGVIRWIKLANDTAVAVDQLGVRQGAVAVYLDVWHKDIPEFLQLRTNNGDDRMKAHDVFPAVCYPNLFWEMVEKDINGTWYLMCPYEIYKAKGYHLEDYYGTEWEEKYKECVADPKIDKRTIVVKDLIRLILKSAIETGTPFTFNRDIVNKANPNKHQGIIYCSNLCTEIAQNMKEIELVSNEITTEDGDTVVVEKTKPGDFVVCNLASLVLGNIDTDNEQDIEETVSSVVRALDNVIDLNMYPLPYAQVTNQKYRSIGLGMSGYHHMLAKHHIKWESKEHLEYADTVFESINYSAIKASMNLSKEKGSYTYFKNSEWETGKYFERRGYTSDKWQALKEQVRINGIRNAYLMAVAPTSSTSIITGTTAGLDPIMDKFFLEEKKSMIIPRVAPGLSQDTFWYYKSAHTIDQNWSIKACGIRQRHIDQAMSMNLYITNDMTFRTILDLYIAAYKNNIKTIYYLRSKSLEVEECASCSA
ncbi:MAG: ribonucleoside-diphosphate reductase subunit alpha [Treponema sp. CETP13]|nr:MAG: ribonucleoside-diphosphate reductase subunit alpha [Treponema sp. CETP13]